MPWELTWDPTGHPMGRPVGIPVGVDNDVSAEFTPLKFENGVLMNSAMEHTNPMTSLSLGVRRLRVLRRRLAGLFGEPRSNRITRSSRRSIYRANKHFFLLCVLWMDERRRGGAWW